MKTRLPGGLLISAILLSLLVLSLVSGVSAGWGNTCGSDYDCDTYVDGSMTCYYDGVCNQMEEQCDYSGQDSDYPDCDYQMDGMGTCYYDGSADCTSSGWTCEWGSSDDYQSCDDTCDGDTRLYNGDWSCSSSGGYCDYSSESCPTGDTCSWEDTGATRCDGDQPQKEQSYEGTDYTGCSSGSCTSTSCSGTRWVDDGSSCSTGDTCSWEDDGSEYCDGNDVVQDQEESGTDYTGCSGGSCTWTSCSGSRTITVESCPTGEDCGSWSDTGATSCDGDQPIKEQERSCTDYEGCSGGSCQEDTSTETRWVDDGSSCSTGDTCSWEDTGDPYCDGDDVVQDEENTGTDYTGCDGGDCTSTSCTGTNTYTVETCRTDEECDDWGDWYCDDDGSMSRDGECTDYKGCSGGSCDSDTYTDTESEPCETNDCPCMQRDTKSNSEADPGMAWIEGDAFHWTDGSTEYWIINENNVESSGHTGSKGHAWIDGEYFYWIDQNGDKRRYHGAATGSSPSANTGTAWIDGNVHYVDEFGDERVLQ